MPPSATIVPDAGRGVEGRDAGAAGAQPLGQRALRGQLDLQLAGEVEPGQLLVAADERADRAADPAGVEQHAERLVVDAAVVGDRGEVAGALLEQRVDERDRDTAEPEPADGERGAVGDVGDGLAGRGHDLVHARAPIGSAACGRASIACPRSAGRRRAVPTGRNGPRELLARGPRCAGMELTCPKCHGTMRTYERNGVHVDQCTDCRGIFLDRGELDRLIDAENAWHGGAQPASRATAEDQRRDEPRRAPAVRHAVRPATSRPPRARASAPSSARCCGRCRARSRSSHQSSEYGYKKRKKESFLGDLFG